MKVLVAMSSPEYLRFYDETLVELARRGHDVVLAVNAVREGKPVRFDAIERADARISVAGLIPERGDGWTALARAVRGTMDFARYLHPQLAPAALLRARVKRQALPWTLQWCDRVRALDPDRVARLMRGLAAIERAIPPAGALLRFLDVQAPDLVLVSPLVEPASDQVDLVRAAQARGMRVATLVASWDNLTNKGDLRVATGLVAVWNEAQKREAVELHRVAPERVVVTGAQPFDRWFERRVSRTRTEFCRDAGLADERPFVLFTGSSIFIARAEVEMPFVRRWIEALRASADPTVRDLGVLVRPHPYNGRAWDPDALADMEGVAVWPRGGYDPVDEGNRAGLFDSLSHCEAVVGINTSAMIEAAIVGRPVLSIETPQFVGSQDGTLHYRHLLPENGGFLRVASTFEEHIEQLAAVLRNPSAARQELAAFVRVFVRPQGLDTPSMPVLVDALERFGATPRPAPAGATSGQLVLRLLLAPLAHAGGLLLPPAGRKRPRRRRDRGGQPDAGRRTNPAPPPVAVWVAALGPLAVALTLVTAFVGLDLAGRTPFAYAPPANAAEAAAMASGSETLRYLESGEDPTRPVAIRPDIISSSVTRVTVAEAAVWSRRPRLVQLVEHYGGIPDAETRHHLACLASDIRAEEIVQYLAPAGASGCAPGETSRSIEARAR